MKYIRILSFLITCLFKSVQATATTSLPKGFVYLTDIDPSIQQNISFATDNNCVGKKVDGYESREVICTLALAKELKKVQTALKKINPSYSLQVLDAYRPAMATQHLKRWAADLNDQKTKAKCYPDIDKKDLLGKFVAAGNSSHNRGSTVDITIIDTKTGEVLDFGPNFFGDYAHVNYSGLSDKQRKNRWFLRKLMLEYNFKAYDVEFWHFILKNEPYPNSYFNFVVEGKEKVYNASKDKNTLSENAKDYLLTGTIYKILTLEELQDFQSSGYFKGSRLDQEDGFIHASFENQYQNTIKKFFKNIRPLVLVKIDTKLLEENCLKVEANRAGGDKYPHIYGNIPFKAVVSFEIVG